VTPWQTWLTHSMWVTDSMMLCSLPRFCLVHPVDCFDSEGWRVVQLWPGDILTVCRVFGEKACNIEVKRRNFWVSPGSAEALVRWGGKIKYLLSQQHLCQKLLQSNHVCKDYSKSKVGHFLRQYIMVHLQEQLTVWTRNINIDSLQLLLWTNKKSAHPWKTPLFIRLF